MLIILGKSVPFVAAPQSICKISSNTAPTKLQQSNTTLRCRFCSFQAGYFDKILVDISSD